MPEPTRTGLANTKPGVRYHRLHLHFIICFHQFIHTLIAGAMSRNQFYWKLITMKKIIPFLLIWITASQLASAQINGLLKRVKNKVENKVETKADQKIDKASDNAMDVKENKPAAEETKTTTDDKATPVEPASTVSAFSRFDFIPGEKIL